MRLGRGLRTAGAVPLSLVIALWPSIAPVSPVHAAVAPVSWTRPTEPGIVHQPPEVARVGDTMTVMPPVGSASCWLTIAANIEYHWRSMEVSRQAGPTSVDTCPPWTFVLPPTPPGTYSVHGTGQGTPTNDIVEVQVTQGTHRTYTSSPYPAVSWSVVDAFDSPPAFGLPMVISPPPGIDGQCRYSFNGGGNQNFGSPENDRSCDPWHVTIPELRPYPFMESGLAYPWETTYIFDGQSNPDVNGIYTTRSMVPFDMDAGGPDPATSDRPFIVWESSANPGWFTPGTVTAVPTLVAIEAGTCVYSSYVYPGDTGFQPAGTVPVVDGACAPLEFAVPESALYGHVQYVVTVRDSSDADIGTAMGGANIVEPMQLPTLSAASSVVAGAAVDVSATIDTGAPVGYTVTGTQTSTAGAGAAIAASAGPSAQSTTETETSTATTTCGTGILDPTAPTNTARARCRFQTAGSYSVRVSIRDASGHTVARSKSVRVVPDTFAPHADAPVARPFVGGTKGASWPVALSLSGSDVGTGIARYQVSRSKNGAEWVRLSSGVTALSFTAGVVSGHTYRFRVRAIDRAGHWSSWTAGPTMRVSTRQESEASYVGTWRSVAASSASGGRLRSSSTAGAKASLTFLGRSVAIVSPLGPGFGHARIYVDGTYVKTIDLERAASIPRQLVFARTWKSSGSHRVTIRVVGDGPVPVDAFLLLR